MSCDDKVDCGRRRLLVATATVGGVAGVATAIPFVSTFAPSERAKSAGAPVEADISKLAPGQMMTVEWRGKPVWIIHRTKEMLDNLTKLDDKMADPKSNRLMQPGYAKNEYRSIKPEYLVAIGICTHLGCSPTEKFTTGAESGVTADWQGGFFCPCHGSIFDLAGRVYKSMPAPDNLEIPPHVYLSDAKILIGEDKKGA
ncbi:MAG: ubiquinol-cytochrome c reductase iron-sulfur subunit [Gammaproteobacteria bacterium]|nr:ubiquinol-cytochrome c reductase iron-sulfur subunit [Rhodocyclaceae bacterium]MBU3909968.1 ubiquinol-cytochrome c reductase iron-sulfur subunit [Gammaproteobacteria bacterium]MBU4003941.1 ubiquinol-cytochrome c reductase iron-sulfur subunit [Gammaproteobacteria bacterium]MBU4020188.1 ubiquinol-cytochrome c reductase iron-sulfur subunit [Gammaproteobacteria bacterium]MBU4095312.1 ubiquinol-cytochrome c reductase iron-sulfur subunit [Gammaproteobacteria bacterium]